MTTETLSKNEPWKETLQVAYDAWVTQSQVSMQEFEKTAKLRDLVRSLCDHPLVVTTEKYYSGSYYDQASTDIVTECKVCGHTTTKDSGWRGGYG